MPAQLETAAVGSTWLFLRGPWVADRCAQVYHKELEFEDVLLEVRLGLSFRVSVDAFVLHAA